MILIVGGSGILGGYVARALLAEGRAVRVMTRRPERADTLRAAGAEVLQGDLLDRTSLVRACAGVEGVVAAAHSLLGRGANASVHVDGAGHRRLIDVARAAGVRHFVYTSVYDYGPAYRTVPFFRIKGEVERYLKASGLTHTILRPTAFMDVHAHVLIGESVLSGGRVLLFGRGTQPRNFVAAEDVAAAAVRALQDPSLANATIDVAGPENLTSLEVVRVYERASGRTARLLRIPLAVPRGASALLRPLHPGVSQMLQMAVLADVAGQRVDGRAIMSRIGVEPVPLEDWVRRKLREADAAHAAT